MLSKIKVTYKCKIQKKKKVQLYYKKDLSAVYCKIPKSDLIFKIRDRNQDYTLVYIYIVVCDTL